MKVAYSKTSDESGHDLMKQAKEFEKEDLAGKAITLYKRMIKMHYRRDLAFQRLMVIYRNLKEYKKEMEVIDEAIEAFSKIIFQTKKVHNKKVELLSKKLTKLTGLADKKNEQIHQPQPIHGWQVRKKRLQKLVEK